MYIDEDAELIWKNMRENCDVQRILMWIESRAHRQEARKQRQNEDESKWPLVKVCEKEKMNEIKSNCEKVSCQKMSFLMWNRKTYWEKKGKQEDRYTSNASRKSKQSGEIKWIPDDQMKTNIVKNTK